MMNKTSGNIMKSGILILLFSLLFTACEEEQVSSVQSKYFLKFFGSYSLDSGNDVIALDNGYILTGTKSTPGNDDEIVLIKTDEFGNQAWEKTFGGEDDDQGISVLETEDQGFLVLGTATDTTGDKNIILLKIDAGGNLEWQKQYGGENDEEARIAKKLTDGFLLMGTIEENGNQDILLIRTNSNGDTLWQSTFGGSGDESGNDLLVTFNGYLIVGTTNSFSMEGQGNNNILVLKTNLSGGLVDMTTHGGTSNDFGNAIVKYGDGFIICGTSQSYAESGSDLLLLRINDNYRTVLWNKTFGGQGNDEGKDLLVRKNEIVAVGTDEITGGFSGYFLKVDPDGNQVMEKKYGGTGSQVINSLDVTPDNGFVFIGSSNFEQNSMILLTKTNSDGELSD